MRTRAFLLKISFALALSLCFTGCDYFRGHPACDFLRILAGRPTSEEIAVKGKTIEQLKEIKARNARLARIADSIAVVDSIEAREAFVVDSLQAAGVLSVSKNIILWSSDTGSASLMRNYYVMIGAFSIRENAEKLMVTASIAGYEPVLICMSNGLFAVALNGSDYAREICPVFEAIRLETFCPKGAWILSKQ